MKTAQPTVYIVDDDPEMRESLRLLVTSVDLKAETYASAEELLELGVEKSDAPKCMVLDVRMPGLGGLGLQKKLADAGTRIPVIMITAHADVEMAVGAMHAGVLDFIEKPFNRQTLLDRIHQAIDKDAHQLREEARRAEVAARLATLSPRERETMELLVAGKHAKQIAAKFGIGEKTVAKHRTRVFEKMKVDGVAELVRLVLANSPDEDGREL